MTPIYRSEDWPFPAHRRPGEDWSPTTPHDMSPRALVDLLRWLGCDGVGLERTAGTSDLASLDPSALRVAALRASLAAYNREGWPAARSDVAELLCAFRRELRGAWVVYLPGSHRDGDTAWALLDAAEWLMVRRELLATCKD